MLALRGVRVLELEGSTLAASLVGRHLYRFGRRRRLRPRSPPSALPSLRGTRACSPPSAAASAPSATRRPASSSSASHDAAPWDVCRRRIGRGRGALHHRHARVRAPPRRPRRRGARGGGAGARGGCIAAASTCGCKASTAARTCPLPSPRRTRPCTPPLPSSPCCWETTARRPSSPPSPPSPAESAEPSSAPTRLDVHLEDAVRDTLVHNSLRLRPPA